MLDYRSEDEPVVAKPKTDLPKEKSREEKTQENYKTADQVLDEDKVFPPRAQIKKWLRNENKHWSEPEE